ncbi:hypothetical protein Emag_002882 [Eimeria magna]
MPMPVDVEPENTIFPPSEAQVRQEAQRDRLSSEEPQQLGQDQNPPQGQDFDTVSVQLQQQLQEHTACMRVFRLYYEALFTSIRSLHLSERSCLPPWEPPRATRQASNCGAPRQESSAKATSEDLANAAEAPERTGFIRGVARAGVAGETQRGGAERLPQVSSTRQCARRGGLWDELGGHPRAMVEFEMELVHNNRNRLLQTLEKALNRLELHGANATRLIERSLALQQQQAQLGEEDHVSVPHLERVEDQKKRRHEQHSLQGEIVKTLQAESELWKTLEATSRQLDREAPLLGGFPIRLVKWPHNTLLPADYVMPRLSFPPGQTQQQAASPTPDANRQAELSSLSVAASVATSSRYQADTPLRGTPIAEAAGSPAHESAAQTSTAAPEASPTESVETDESAVTRKAAEPSSAAPASVDGAALASGARASDPAAISTPSGSASAVKETIPRAVLVAASHATAELAAARVDQMGNGSSPIPVSPATTHEPAASISTDDFAIRSFPGPIVVQNPLVHRLPCRRLQQRRSLPLGAADEVAECRGPAVGRPGYTVIRLPLWMQRQPPDLAQSFQLQQQQVQQQELGRQDSGQQERGQEQERQQQELVTGQLHAMRILEEMLQRRNADGAVLDFHNELERQQGSLSAEYSTTNPSSLHSMLSVSPRSGSTNTESPPTINTGRPPTEGES